MNFKNFFNLLFFILLLHCSIDLIAQKGILQGLVSDSKNGEPLIGATIRDNNTSSSFGAVSDIDGRYSIDLPEGNYIIEASMIGFLPKTFTVSIYKGKTTIQDIQLQEEAMLMNTVVLTATKFEKPLSEQVVSMDVIRPSLIANSNSTDISQTIEKVPGVDVIDGQANIRCGSGYSYGAGSRVLLLMDDLPILTADSGFPNWDFLPVENIGQVEVVKGAASALYGSSAMNGIINIRTAYPTSDPFVEVSGFGTVYNKPRGNQVNDTLEKAWWGNKPPYETGLSLAYRQKFGHLDMVSGCYLFKQKSWRQSDYEDRGRINLNLRYRLPNKENFFIGLNTNMMLNQGASFLIWDYTPDAGDESYNPGGAYQLWKSTPQINNDGFKLSLDPFVQFGSATKGLRHKILGRYYKNNNQNDTNQSTNSDFFYSEYQVQKSFEDAAFSVTGGLVGSHSKAAAELYSGDGKFEAKNVAIYAQLDKKINKLNMSLGGRYEWNEIEGDKEAKPVMRAGLNYQAAAFTYIRASFGQAYRFPTIAEKFVRTSLSEVNLGLPIEIGIYPNPNLKSETGWSAELGVKQGIKIGGWEGYVDAAGFINRYNDMMEFTFGVPDVLLDILGFLPDFADWGLDTTIIQIPSDVTGLAAGFQSINIGNTQILGADISVAGRNKLFGCPTNVLMGYTYTKPTFQNFDSIQYDLSSYKSNILKYRFQHTVKLDIESKIGKFTPGISLRYYSFMQAIDEAFNRFLPGVREFREEHNGGTTILDLRLIYNIAARHSVSILAKNVTNLEYALRPALIDAPRSFTLKYNYKIHD